jgi:hypothetical protein
VSSNKATVESVKNQRPATVEEAMKGYKYLRSPRTEEEILDDIFGTPCQWRGHRVRWCELCQCWSVSCKKDNCDATSCNCAGCPDCTPLFKEFDALKFDPQDHLTREENEVIYKFDRLKQLTQKCFSADRRGLDWVWLESQGSLCDNDWEMFKLDIPETYGIDKPST